MSIEDDMLAEQARRRGLTVTQLRMLMATPDRLMRDLAGDARRSRTPGSIIPTKDSEPSVKRGTGWADEVPLSPPPGVNILDKIMDVEDARGRRQRERERGGL